MTELREIFAELGISQYLQDFLDQGFDSWDTILDITESDFDALGVKLGHRRKLQRKIANSRGLSSDRALASPSRNTPSDDRHGDDQKQSTTKSDAKETGSGPHGAKRKYRRHPKPDENAPERHPSAYVIFSNKMREDLKGRSLSFTEIAKLVGENWQNLAPADKEQYETAAFAAKEKYNSALAEYKTTTEYKDYAQYLVEFKARQSNQQQVTDLEVAKRPKIEARQSGASNGSSSTSQQGDVVPGRTRVESSASNTSQWLAHESQPSPQLTGIRKLNVMYGQGSVPATSPPLLPGYRDPMFGSGVPQNHQTLAWRDGVRDENNMPGQQLPVAAAPEDRRPSYSGPLVTDPPGLVSMQHAHRTGRTSHPPPLLSSESTAGRSRGSSVSTSSSAFFGTPRTPMEHSLDRALPIPSLYTQKSFENPNQLPPLRPISLSPQNSMAVSQQSPIGIPPVTDYLTASGRGYAPPHPKPPGDNNDPRLRQYMSASSPEDLHLDPVSALLKAGEIVDRTSRNQPSS